MNFSKQFKFPYIWEKEEGGCGGLTHKTNYFPHLPLLKFRNNNFVLHFKDSNDVCWFGAQNLCALSLYLLCHLI